jgi:REP element-mobilizing transposase RayT
MARLLRIEIPGAAYYVTSRGLEGQGIARDEVDCAKWFERLDGVARRRRWRVAACVVMPSHYHLLVETPEGDLSAGMHDLNAGYATAFNRRHGRRGPLLAGRFKAILIEPGYRTWEISRHIHLNPVRLGHAKRPQDWPFGSCGAYLGTALAPAWLAWREVLLRGPGRALKEDVGTGSAGDCVAQAPPPVPTGQFPPPEHSRGRLCHTGGPVEDSGHRFASVAEARGAYERFLAEGVERPRVSPLWAATAGVALGSPEFVRRVRAWLEGQPRRREAPAARALRRTAGVEAIERAVCAVFGVEEGRLRERRRWRNQARAAAEAARKARREGL